MGYYSDAALALYERDYRAMVTEAADNPAAFDWVTRGCERYVADAGGERAVILYWNGVKWYDGFPEIDFVSEWMGGDDRRFAFVRIGEEFTDVETSSTDGELEYCISIRQEIDFNSVTDVYSDPEEPDPTESEELADASPQDLFDFLGS